MRVTVIDLDTPPVHESVKIVVCVIVASTLSSHEGAVSAGIERDTTPDGSELTEHETPVPATSPSTSHSSSVVSPGRTRFGSAINAESVGGMSVHAPPSI